MISKMGGKMMYFYADDLTNLLLDDILAEIVFDLQDIENKERDGQTAHESK